MTKLCSVSRIYLLQMMGTKGKQKPEENIQKLQKEKSDCLAKKKK